MSEDRTLDAVAAMRAAEKDVFDKLVAHGAEHDDDDPSPTWDALVVSVYHLREAAVEYDKASEECPL